MFRPLRRIKQQLTQKECISVLKNEVRGVLSVLGDNDYPYGIPINYWYNEDENRIYFHGSREGHKIDAIKKCDKVFECYMRLGGRGLKHKRARLMPLNKKITLEYITGTSKECKSLT